MGIVRALIAGILGGAFALALPRLGVLAATQEIIAFLSLLMAGLLPAMILTATILRGDGMSVHRVDSYTAALQAQMVFWATLFLAALATTVAIVGAKIFSTTGVDFSLALPKLTFTDQDATTLCVGAAGAGVGVVFQRLHPAFVGIQSLLELNGQLARAQAKLTQTALAEALLAESRAARTPEAYAKTQPGKAAA
ncbi:hypothetical protein [Phenylobacterium sp.]|uniref:hypothetical protein n=1 Tax=Phenylobacterium sp. TaxID=1871053 RepID=UPI00273231D6|nr:hypothetical protein [Phenylobacterium sp.]MDP3853135.1 hypothetical protein [Phenylobacterium sp.]